MHLRFWEKWEPCHLRANDGDPPCERVKGHGGNHRYSIILGEFHWRIEPNGSYIGSMRKTKLFK